MMPQKVATQTPFFTGTYARRHNVWDFNTTLPPLLLKNSLPGAVAKRGISNWILCKYGVGDYKVGDDFGDGIGPLPRVPPRGSS